MRAVVVAVVVALCVFGAVAQANLISDPGFEGSGAGPWSLEMNPVFTYSLDSTVEAHSGAESMSVSWSGIDGWLLAEAHQEFSVTGGNPWYLQAYVKITTQLDDPCFAYLETLFYDGAGQIGGVMSEKQSAVTDWKLLANSTTIPVGAITAKARLVTFNEGGASSGGTLYWDDVLTDEAIPEPATVAMLGMALAGLLVARRRAGR